MKSLDINKAYIRGTVAQEPTFSHAAYGEDLFDTVIEVPRLSQHSDMLPLTLSARQMQALKIEAGSKLAIEGQFRSYNKYEEGKSRLILTLFARDIFDASNFVCQNPNQIELSGYICKPTIFRVTPFNREIADMILASRRAFDKTDYIPCIAWGSCARQVGELAVGERIRIFGRIQSRNYNKTLPNGESETRTAYEVSVNRLDSDFEQGYYAAADIQE